MKLSPIINTTKYWKILFILFISFIAKFAFRLVATHNQNYWDSGYSSYFHMAIHFLKEGVMYYGDPPDKMYAFLPPIYPFFIATICKFTNFSVSCFVLCEALISTFTVLLTYLITIRITNKRAALCSAFLCAFYPYSFIHDTQLQETVLFNFFSICSIYCFLLAFEKKNTFLFFLTGCLLGITFLTRSTHLIHSFFIGILLLFGFRTEWKKLFVYCTVFFFGFMLFLTPWVVRNKVMTGSFALTSKTGISLAIANNAYTFTYFPYRGSIDKSTDCFMNNLSHEDIMTLEKLKGQSEFAVDKWYKNYALEYIKKHKLQTLFRGFYKVSVNFLGILSPLQDNLKNWAYFLSYWILTLLAVYSIKEMYQNIFTKIFLLLCLSQAICSFIFWAHTSHRAFLDPMLAVFAGIGLSLVINSLKKFNYQFSIHTNDKRSMTQEL